MGLTTYMIFQEHALSHTSVYFLKIVLSLSGGVMLATLPGFFDINYTFGGLSVRAAGGAAAFIFIYTQSPALPALQNAQDPGAGAHQYREQRKPDKSSMRSDGFPVLMALSVSPGGFASGDSYYQQTAVHVDGGGSSGGGILAGEGGISIGEAVTRDLSAFGGAVLSYLGRTLSAAKYWVDRAAALLRAAVDKTTGVVRNLLGLGAPSGGHPQTIALLEEDVSERLTDVTGALLGSEQGLLGGLAASLSDTTTALVGGLSRTVGGLVATTDVTVSGLVTGLHGTTNHLLNTTDTLVANVTGVLDKTTGGLTAGLTAPVEKIAGGLTDTTGKIVDTVLPRAVTATSAVFSTVDKSFERITDRLNEITPAIVGKLDPDFIARERDARGLDHAASALRGPVLDNGLLPTAAMLPDRVLGKLDDAGLLRGDRLRLGGSDLDTSQSRCISGCGGLVAGTVSGLRDTVDGLSGGLRGRGAGGGGLLGGDPGGGGRLLGLAGGGGGEGGPGGGAGEAGGGGPVAGTLQQTRSLVGGTVRSLRRR